MSSRIGQRPWSPLLALSAAILVSAAWPEGAAAAPGREAPGTEATPTTETKAPAVPRRSALSISYAGAIHASGNILADAVIGLDGLEALINTQFLYAPAWTPVVRAVGPVYQIPDFVLRNDRFVLQYERHLAGNWVWSVGLGLQVLYAFAGIPISFVDLERFGLGAGYIPVTAQSGGRLNLAQSYQLDGAFRREFEMRGPIQPFVELFFGLGSGWLGRDRSAWLQEAHLGLGTGATWDLNPADFLRFHLEAMGYHTMTRGTNFIDRTQVLVNPGNGEIVIVQLRLSVGRRF